ncbi:NusG domain II-containing protein [Agathobaculum sp.]|uniref:NusG domain II-containing protein n=1 Tax=Agathobaculum sp. TaxID=2048138 RepID=UPI002A814B95|nr:NusG domain II-containing protein [Agathobaculum sp.]MDY3618522.1 NusG domain II-containing protein [Agathobaculum sp.]
MCSKLKWGDLVIIAAVLVTAGTLAVILSLQTAGDRLYAEVWQDGVQIERVELTDKTNQTIDLGGHNLIVLSGKTARMVQADCRDQVCVRTGTLTRAGQAAVCLPHKVVLKLVGGKSEVDAIVS